jgi:copper transport outer membrane protein MctB
MFDFRYHVTSLAAVFIALVIGILVGVAISGRSLIRDTERRVLENDIAELQQQLSDAERQVGQQNALEEYARVTYPAVMAGRLTDRRIGVVYVGSAEGEVAAGIQETIDRADGVQGMRALQVPIATGELLRRAAEVTDGPRTVEDLGRSLARELVDGGDTPLWDAVGPALVEEREGGNLPLDAVVVARTAEPQSGQTARFLSGFYSGLAAAGVPVVGVETTDSGTTAVPTYRGHGFSTVDNVDTIPGRVALAVLLTGESPGSYGTKEDNTPVLPPVEPVVPATE